ncbi:hypothetical protein ABGB21_34930 [Plantactinospora sp. B24E8]
MQSICLSTPQDKEDRSPELVGEGHCPDEKRQEGAFPTDGGRLTWTGA